jgi:outer membrane immunogenic protein
VGLEKKMKKILLATVGMAALGMAGLAPAFAADLAPRTYTKAPAMVAVYDWTGFYIGINAGGASSHNCWDLNNIGGLGPIPSTREGCHDATGAVVGGQIGYRWQSASWVFGVEAQGDWADLKGSNTSSLAALAPVVNQTKIDAIGLFTGQVGYSWNNVLGYVKGGAAVTHDKYSGSLPGFGQFDQASETRWGGAVGAGLEVGFAPGWSVGVEYDHLFMGRRDITFPGGTIVAPGLIANSRTDSIKQDVDMATVRLNYRFGGPVIAKY